ncbi:hypothetical protein D3OALGA1CA_157 [Olavius algarvensis associated proteobacterium Delta 3]|nr:hypothetical protein D3OALGA1CA_157 [Olavius algarvensis associated proteobacterium Delta 3]
MRKWVMVLVMVAFMGLAFGAGNVDAGRGPAPNSGDGIPDGPGWPVPGPFGPFGD